MYSYEKYSSNRDGAIVFPMRINLYIALYRVSCIMRLHSLFLVFFLWDFTAASQALNAAPSDAPPPVGTVADHPNDDSGVTMSVQGPVQSYSVIAGA